jgi:hypothetical protein
MNAIGSNRMRTKPSPLQRVPCMRTQGATAAPWRLALCLLLALAASPLLSAGPAQAQATRTYVSGTGKDGSACPVTSPCKTFQAALAATAAGGEIYVLNSANYGPVTINKAVTITSEGAVAGVLATSGAGITINAGASDVVNLRGLDIDGGASGGVGIQFTAGKALIIQKSVVRGFTSVGISFAPSGASTLFVSDTVATNNATNGILIAGSGTVGGALSRVTATGNGVGIFASGANVNLTIINTVAANNNYGVGASAAAVMVRNSTISNNAIGIAADQSALVRVDQSTVTANGTGWQASNGGQVQSYGSNNVSGNTTDGTPTTTVVLQ